MIAATGNPPSSVGTFTAPPSRTFRKRPGGSETFQLTATQTLRVDTPSNEQFSFEEDRTMRTVTVGSSATDYTVSLSSTLPGVTPTVQMGSTNAGVIAAAANGTATAVSSGRSVLFARAASGEVSAVAVDVLVTGATTIGPAFNNVFQIGSLSRHLQDSISSRQSGKTLDDVGLFSVRDNDLPSYVRNPNNWLADLNLTGLPVWNSETFSGGGGALVTPRHALFIRHCQYHPLVGDTVRFVTAGNAVVSATVDSFRWHPANGVNNELYSVCGLPPNPWDVVVVRFSADLPESITPMKTLPSTWTGKLPSAHFTGTGKPSNRDALRAFYVNQFRNAYVAPLGECTDFMFPNSYGQLYKYSNWTGTVSTPGGIGNPPWYGPMITIGDSGDPICAIVNNEPAIVGMVTGSTFGPFIPGMASDINGMLTDLGGGYQLSYVDIGSFPTY